MGELRRLFGKKWHPGLNEHLAIVLKLPNRLWSGVDLDGTRGTVMPTSPPISGSRTKVLGGNTSQAFYDEVRNVIKRSRMCKTGATLRIQAEDVAADSNTDLQGNPTTGVEGSFVSTGSHKYHCSCLQTPSLTQTITPIVDPTCKPCIIS